MGQLVRTGFSFFMGLGGKINIKGKKTCRKTRTSEEKCSIINYHPFCVYCGGKDSLVIDHIYPLIRGGSEDFENLTVSCAECNNRKWDYNVYMFQEVILKKREVVLNEAKKWILLIRKIRKGYDSYYHTEDSLYYRILQCRKKHSYFSRIVNSISNERFNLFG